MLLPNKFCRSQKYSPMKTKYYFDYAASAPPFKDVLQKYTEVASKYFGNPSSAHSFGITSRELILQAKTEILRLGSFSSGYLGITSSGTEANNLVIRGVMEKYPGGRLLLAGDVHESSWFAEKKYKKRTDLLSIDSAGKVDRKELKKAIKPNTKLCSVLFGNNETGIVDDINTIGDICSQHGVLLHCDGVQAFGHLPLVLDRMSFDFFTFSAHKFGGLRGTGGVFMRSSDFAPQISGGYQEQGLRAGTENLAGLVSTAAALLVALENLGEETNRLRNLGELFVKLIRERCPDFILNSDLKKGLPGLISLSFPGLAGTSIVTELALKGFAISAGSACHSQEKTPSRVIVAFRGDKKIAEGSIRISMGRFTEDRYVQELADALLKSVYNQKVFGS